jgi:HEAT repeat protein/glycerophosphoryl diester phosphodiesterase
MGRQTTLATYHQGNKKITDNRNMRCISIVSILFLLSILPFSVLAEEPRKVEIFVHHGIVEEVPENTFAALRRAVKLGVDGIKVDIRQTKDNQLILMCDETIDRTTNGKGRVDQLSFAEIQQYDAGSWRGIEFKNERAPLLSDVLNFCRINNLKLILDIKQAFLEKQVLDLVVLHRMPSQVYLWGMLRNFDTEDSAPSIKELVFVSPTELTEGRISRIRAERKYVYSTIHNTDDRETIKDLLKSGVDVILVDYPYVALDILGVKSQILTNKHPLRNRNREIGNFQQEEINNTAFIQEKTKTLVRTLRSRDYDEGRTAALALMVLPQKYTVPPLIKLLKNRHPSIKQNAVWALGFCGTKDSAVYIQPLLKDKNPEVRREAVLALGRLGNARSVPVLIDALKTETDPGVRYDMVRTLGTLGDQGTAFTLRTILMKEKSWHVKSAAVGALSRIHDDKAINDLANILVTDAGEDAAWTRAKATWVLASMGEKSVPQLVRALSDTKEVTRLRATWALVKIGSPAVKSLISTLRDPNKFARERAAQALGWIEDESAVTALAWALKDKEPAVVCSAAWALGRIGDPRALPSLKSLMNHKNDEIRENVNEAVVRIKKT